MAFCSNCGAQVEDGAAFCDSCGARLVSARRPSAPAAKGSKKGLVITLAALLILFVYYAFILRNLPLHPKMSVILPVAVIIGFVGCVVCEALLFFGFGFGLEASPLRTLVIRPVFYLGFIGLCVYFLFPPPLMEDQIDYYT